MHAARLRDTKKHNVSLQCQLEILRFCANTSLVYFLFGNMQTKLAPGEPGRKKKTEHRAGHDERACLGGSAGGW